MEDNQKAQHNAQEIEKSGSLAEQDNMTTHLPEKEEHPSYKREPQTRVDKDEPDTFITSAGGKTTTEERDPSAHEDMDDFGAKLDNNGQPKGMNDFGANLDTNGQPEGMDDFGANFKLDTNRWLEHPGRQPKAEIFEPLLSCDLVKGTGCCPILPSRRDCHVQLVQRDAKNFRRIDGSNAAAFLLQCTIRSKTNKLKGATVHLSLPDSANCHFLAATEPSKAAEFVQPGEVDGVICFENSNSGARPLYVGHKTAGAMSCGLVGTATAYMRLLPDPGKRLVGCLSAMLLVCLTFGDSLVFGMNVSVQASLKASGLFSLCRKGRGDVHELKSRKIRLLALR